MVGGVGGAGAGGRRSWAGGRDPALGAGAECAGRVGEIGQRVHVEDVTGREHHPALDDVLELADVAGPVVGAERGHRPRRDVVMGAGPARQAAQEGVGQQRDLVHAVAQGGQGHREDVAVG